MSRHSIRHAAWLVPAVGLLVRLIYVAQSDISPVFAHPVVDGKSYVDQAVGLASGNWLGMGEGPYWQPPLYPWLLGLVAAVSGNFFFYAVRLIQAVLGAATCWLTWDIGRRLFGPVAGLAAGLATALYGPLIFFDAEFLPVGLATLLDVWGLWLLMRALEKPSGRRFLCAGAAFGLAALAVPTVLAFLGAAVPYVAWAARREGGAWVPALRRGMLVAAGAAVVVAPVTARNYLVGGDTVLVSWNGGVNYYIGNNPDYEGTVAVRPGWEWTDLVTRPDRAGVTQPSAKSAWFSEQARAWITAEPMAWLDLQLRKTAEFWRGHEVGRNQPLYYWRRYSPVLAATLWQWGVAFPFGLLAPLALLGIALNLRRPDARLPLLFILVYSAAVIAYFPAARYRLPVVPVLAVFAGAAALQLAELLRRGERRRLTAALAALVILTTAVNVGGPPMDMDGNADIHYNLGDAYLRAGRPEAAWASFSRAVEKDSTFWEARFYLGTIRGIAGDLPGAETILTRVAEAQPQRPELWSNLATVYLGKGDPDAAETALERAVDAAPGRHDVWEQLLAFLVEREDVEEAETVLVRAVEEHPDNEPAFERIFTGQSGRRGAIGP